MLRSTVEVVDLLQELKTLTLVVAADDAVTISSVADTVLLLTQPTLRLLLTV